MLLHRLSLSDAWAMQLQSTHQSLNELEHALRDAQRPHSGSKSLDQIWNDIEAWHMNLKKTLGFFGEVSQHFTSDLRLIMNYLVGARNRHGQIMGVIYDHEATGHDRPAACLFSFHFPTSPWLQQVDGQDKTTTSENDHGQDLRTHNRRAHSKFCPLTFTTIARQARPPWSNLANKLRMALRGERNEEDNEEGSSNVHKYTLLPPWDTVALGPLDTTATEAAGIRTKAHAALVQVLTHECPRVS
jgi:hypothetical protein